MNRQVILLHGLVRTPLSMAHLGGKLRSRGFQVLNYGYPSRKLTLEAQASRFNEFLSTRIDRSAQLNFITHSLGGIITRQFALTYGREYSLKRLVMLGPPNQGSEMARRVKRLGFTAAILGPAFEQVCDLKLDSATDRLEIGVIAGGSKNGRGYSPVLPGNNDGIVRVEETALHGAKDSIVMAGLHSFLMYYPSVIEQAIHFLEHGSFQR